MTTRFTCRTLTSHFLLQLFVCIVAATFTWISHASSVRAVSMAEMLEQSALVFEGRVSSLRSRQDPGTGIIRTDVGFEVLDVIKGQFANKTIVLSFLGGTVGDVTLAAGDMEMPEMNEKGIYFVESLQRRQIHPLYGWSQGHFLIVADERGVERVLTRSRKPVETMQRGAELRRLSDGTALGLTVTDDVQMTNAMTVTEFKQQLSTMLDSLR